MCKILKKPISLYVFVVSFFILTHFCFAQELAQITNLQDFNKGSKHFDFIHHVLSFDVKFIHKRQKDEFLFWHPNFGNTLHLENDIDFQLV